MTNLKLYNSISKRLEDFVPQQGNLVSWYICGPTVYDASHLGHARTYVTFDVLRRVMENYFGFQINHVMNITDIEDKIILRARKQHLFENYKKNASDWTSVLEDVQTAIEIYQSKLGKEENPTKIKMMQVNIDSVKNAIEQKNIELVLDASRDFLSDMLDEKNGSDLRDHSIFDTLSRHWEKDFFDDMAALNVLLPDAITRVSDYINENISFIETIIKNGFGYESNGSVYFDVNKFISSESHEYPKMNQFLDLNEQLIELRDAEGALTSAESEKKNIRDFALWKKSKKGEPEWNSPWGKGRPGWHIECSVMASDLLPGVIDIHCGGIDLKFPHHDNEIAQSEAFYNSTEWVKFFLHSGHLNIDGMKMAKSLKNFTTIKECLRTYSSRQLRFLFLLHRWGSSLDFSETTMTEAVAVEKFYLNTKEFFSNIKNVLRTPTNQLKFRDIEKSLMTKIKSAQENVHLAFCQNIDTPLVIKVLSNLVKETNIYLLKVESEENKFSVHSLLLKVIRYVTNIFKIFGLIEENDSFGFSSEKLIKKKEDVLFPFIKVLAEFRSDVRSWVFLNNPTDKKLLDSCGNLRDELLPQLGVRLEDKKEGTPTVIKFMNENEVKQFKEEKRLKSFSDDTKTLKKEFSKIITLEEKDSEINPKEIFVTDPKYEFWKFDENGIPSIDPQGNAISISKKKKLSKIYEVQKKKHENKFNKK